MDEQTMRGANGPRVSRRRFLLLAGGTLATGMVVCGGGAAMLAGPIPAVDYGEKAYNQAVQTKGAEKMAAKKVLVAYASRYGSTAEVAQAVGARLAERGMAVDVRTVDEVNDLAAYAGVVIGSAVRVGSWLPAAVKFVETNQDALRKAPVAYFCVHFLNCEDTPDARTKRSAYLDRVRTIAAPQAEGFFAGKIDPRAMNFGDKLATKLVGAPSGDGRDWAAIRSWADSLFPG